MGKIKCKMYNYYLIAKSDVLQIVLSDVLLVLFFKSGQIRIQQNDTRDGKSRSTCKTNKQKIVMQSLFLLFASASTKEAGPFKTGLLAAHPENRGDSHHQHHQIFN